MKHKIIYNDFAALADKNAVIPASGSSGYQKSENLLDEDKRSVINYATFESKGINLLDHNLYFAEESDNIGYVSTAISNSNRTLSPAVTVVIELSNGYYSAPGITFHFHQNYCTDFSVVWYKDGAEISSVSVGDCNSLDYYLSNSVSEFNKVAITFEKTETAFQFVKLSGIDLGQILEITDFFGAINVFCEISDDCSDLPGSTCDFEAQISESFLPQSEQELILYADDEFIGKFTVENAERNGVNRYVFECVNDAMKLNAELSAIEQGIYMGEEIANAITSASNVDIETGDYGQTELTGFLEETDARLATAMLAFGIGCFATTYKRKKLTLLKPRNRRNKVITANQILGEAKYKTNSPYSDLILKTFKNDFDTVDSELKYSNPSKRAYSSVGEKVYEEYSLVSDDESRFEEIKECGFYRNEITATIVLSDECVGDILTIETPYNGFKTGIIKSMDITFATAATAEIVIIERGYAANGGEG